MTMFKTPQEIEEMAKNKSSAYANIGISKFPRLNPDSFKNDAIHFEKGFIAGYSQYQKDIQEAIENVEGENKKLKTNLSVCKNDYWFMINLLENYSTDKDQAIKDCVERMKFRSPIFKQESKE